MSKAFKQWYVDTEFDPMAYGAMQASWNTALEHAANVCEEVVTYPPGYGGQWEGYGCVRMRRTGADCAEAIRKEKTE